MTSADPTKFFGCELGAQTTFANDRYIVNGAHQPNRLRELLDTFIEKFVLCPSCHNPETELVITGKSNHEDIHRDCKACGRQNGIDMRHKLVTYILKNPPSGSKDKKKGKKGGMTAEANVGGPMVFDKAAEDGSGEDDLEANVSAGNGVPTSGTDIDAILGRSDPVLDNPDTAEDISRKLKTLEVNGNGNGNGNGSGSGNGNGHTNGHVEDDDDDEDAGSPYAVLGAWLQDNHGAPDAEVIAKIKELGIIGKHKVLLEIGENMFTDDVVNEFPKRITMLQAVRHRHLQAHSKFMRSLLTNYSS